jgi:hypothetical protein
VEEIHTPDFETPPGHTAELVSFTIAENQFSRGSSDQQATQPSPEIEVSARLPDVGSVVLLVEESGQQTAQLVSSAHHHATARSSEQLPRKAGNCRVFQMAVVLEFDSLWKRAAADCRRHGHGGKAPNRQEPVCGRFFVRAATIRCVHNGASLSAAPWVHR